MNKDFEGVEKSGQCVGLAIQSPELEYLSLTLAGLVSRQLNSLAKLLTLKTPRSNLNSHLLPLFIWYRSSGEMLIKYQANSSCVIMSVIHITILFYKALILQGEIWFWSLLGLKGLNSQLVCVLPVGGFVCQLSKISSLHSFVDYIEDPDLSACRFFRSALNNIYCFIVISRTSQVTKTAIQS